MANVAGGDGEAELALKLLNVRPGELAMRGRL